MFSKLVVRCMLDFCKLRSQWEVISDKLRVIYEWDHNWVAVTNCILFFKLISDLILCCTQVTHSRLNTVL